MPQRLWRMEAFADCQYCNLVGGAQTVSLGFAAHISMYPRIDDRQSRHIVIERT